MMSFRDPGYIVTKEIKLGHKKLEPIFIELSDWINCHFGVTPISFYCEQIELGSALPLFRIMKAIRTIFQDFVSPLGPTRVDVIMETDKEVDVFRGQEYWKFNSEFSKKIEEKFIELVKKHKMKSRYNLGHLYVNFEGFKISYFAEVTFSSPQALRYNFLEKSYGPQVWHISETSSGLMICPYLENQIEPLRTSELLQHIKEDYLKIIKPFDYLNYITVEDINISFLSKEEFDFRYGSWENFWRR
jgi:hypothetical protein